MFFKYISRTSSVGDKAIPIAGPFFMYIKELEELKYSLAESCFSSATSCFSSSASFPLSGITVLDVKGRTTENKSVWKFRLALLLVKITLYLEKQKNMLERS